MAKILQLDPHVADLIAAGEVVERPSSVVKELMENSIDSGATVLTVEIKDGGMTYIRVTDNGCGIAEADAATAFLRHATSKLRDERGLEAIGTLGFRGEALAAIAAVSRTSLLTREAASPEGARLFIDGGVVAKKSPAGCPEGTTMIVRDLFFNTPARLKFMKTNRAEGASVSAAVIRCALSHPEVSVQYIKDEKTEFHTPGDGRVDSCVYSLFGRDFAKGLLEAGTSDGDVAVTGYVSSPSAARGNRSYQFFFVNGRYVKSKTLQAALEQAYRNSLFTGKYPTCVLYITLSRSAVDVNVHPAKTEVKFLNERQVFDGVYYAALGALESESSGVEIELSPTTQKALSGSMRESVPEKSAASTPKSVGEFYREMPANKFRSIYGGGFKTSVPAISEKRGYIPVMDESRTVYQTKMDIPKPAFEQATSEIGGIPETAPYRFIGETLGTYILVEREASLWLIDKHAAHERILFDRLKSQAHDITPQPLLTPVICTLGEEDTELILENAGLFESFAFEIEAFGGGAVAVRQIPSDIEQDDVEGLLSEICIDLRLGAKSDPVARLDIVLHTIACKAAIKAGKRSEPKDLEALIWRVLSGEIKYCPHGRPVAIELTKSSLDKNFKRT